MSVFGVILVEMLENTDQNNSENGHFLLSFFLLILELSAYLITTTSRSGPFTEKGLKGGEQKAVQN